MDAIDRYIQRIHEPKLQAARRALIAGDHDEPEDQPSTREVDVAAAEASLGFALPPSYRKLVTTTEPRDKEYGLYWVWVEGLETYGEGIASYADSRDGMLPRFLIPVLGSDDGDEYCFDTRTVDARGEYPIVHFSHEIHDEDAVDFEVVASDLGEFLLGSLGPEEHASD